MGKDQPGVQLQWRRIDQDTKVGIVTAFASQIHFDGHKSMKVPCLCYLQSAGGHGEVLDESELLVDIHLQLSPKGSKIQEVFGALDDRREEKFENRRISSLQGDILSSI